MRTTDAFHAALNVRPGAVLADRYEILELVGQGGMGAVYKAQDRELDRVVAIKVIRPDLSTHAETLRRFKQELILAREIRHRNVVPIYDLGIADGLKFITMEFVEGGDLATRLRQQGKLPPDEAAEIIHQVCLGLEAAHAEGVIHRDLKPQNIMVDPHGKVIVMDFGIARSVEVTGLTRTGALLGTPAYMSPEQARAMKVDARSDLFTLGIIFYELLTGVLPFQADTAMAMLLKRVEEKARPPAELDPAIPKALSDIVMKCLVVAPEERYQSAGEIARAIEQWRAPTAATPQARAAWWKHAWVWLGAAVVVLLVLLGTVMVRWPAGSRAPTAHKAVTLLIADFANSTSDPLFDGTLESSLRLALEGAPFLSAYDREDARRVAAQLRPGATTLDESLARLVAVRQGINAVVSGSIAPRASGYVASVRAVDAVTGNVLASKEIEIADKGAVLPAVGKLAAPVRKTLGDTTPESAQLSAAETFTASSLPAAHAYALAQELASKGQWDEAVKNYLNAIELEPDLGRAYAGIAVAYANLGMRQEAEKYYQLAMARLHRMTEREKYRTRGGYYLMVRNHQKAIEEFTALVAQYPADTAGLTDLALAAFYRRDMPRALAEGKRALEIYPNSVIKRINVGLYAMYAGDFKSAAQELRAVIQRSPTYAKAALALGLCELAQKRVPQANEAYNQAQKMPNWGPSYAATGLADLALYEGRIQDAIGILEKAAAEDLAAKKITAAANKLAMLGGAHLLAGHSAQATAAADRASTLSKEDSVLVPAARIYIDAGQEPKAAKLADELASRLEPDPRAYAKLIRGEQLLKHAKASEAIELFQQSQQIADTWQGRLALARAYLESGKFTEAHSELELCLKRQGEATAVFLDDMPSYRYVPPVYYYLGRAEEGLKSPGSVETYHTFLSMKTSAEDPMVKEVRSRLARANNTGTK